MIEIIKKVPADGRPSAKTGAAFACNTWVKDVLASLHEEGKITLDIDLDALEAQAVEYGIEYAPEAELGKGATVVNEAFQKPGK
ncbi:hypothetical protein E4U21_002506 [Claviceps maximensis]|nr:hypothetical protein E4U21_002506 [Claviceps maximensis]